MKNGNSYLWLLICFFILCGCDVATQSEKDGVESVSNDIFVETTWIDNSMDDYKADFNVSVNPAKLEENFSYGGWNLVLTKTKAYILQKHLNIADYKKAWDELIIVDETGNRESKRLSLPFTPESNNQIVRMGEVYESNHIICINVEEKENELLWRVFELDEELNPQWNFVIDFLDKNMEWFPESILRDREGRIHLDFRRVQSESEDYTHYVVNTSGEVLESFSLARQKNGNTCMYEWMFTEKGELLLKQVVQEKTSWQETVFSGTSSAGIGQVVAVKSYDETQKVFLQYVLRGKDISIYGDEAVLCADGTGIYRCDINWKHFNYLYTWENHGISVNNIIAVRKIEDNKIAVFYQEADGDHLVVLSPAAENVEMREIVLAIPEYREIYYRPIVDAFHKKYPNYRVRINSDYDDSRLLAELGSGNGPVLVDTRLTGFEAQKKLWEPLDSILQNAGLDNVLFKNVMELCKIDGTTYGVTLDFTIYTMLSYERVSADEWNYERFLKPLEEGKYKTVFPAVYGGDSKRVFIFDLFMHGLEDNYLIDTSNPQNYIDREKWNKILDLSEEFCMDKYEGVDFVGMFQNGEVFCECDALQGVTKITELKKKWGKNISIVGFPTNQGGRHLITAVIPLAMRATASEEEKKVATAFLLEALSYEGQICEMENNYNFGISIRKDAFEEQIHESIENYIKLAKINGVSESSIPNMRAELEEDADMFRSLLGEAVPMRRLPSEVESILSEEITSYFNGVIPRELLLDQIQNRIKLYFLENEEMNNGTK